MLMVKSDERSGIVRKRITLLDEYTALHHLPPVRTGWGMGGMITQHLPQIDWMLPQIDWMSSFGSTRCLLLESACPLPLPYPLLFLTPYSSLPLDPTSDTQPPGHRPSTPPDPYGHYTPPH